VAEAVAEYEAAQGGYVDVHAWQFTPRSFGSVIKQLHARKLSGLKIAQVYETPPGQFEFCAVLVKD
jgi:hypothetical protein